MALALAPASAAVAVANNGWALVWSDEFDGNRIDAAKWSLAVDCWGGGNNERQCYTASGANAAVREGILTITALHQTIRGPALPELPREGTAGSAAMTSKPYSSARLSTRGKADWRYGRIEIRAKLPEGQGTWPAIWMLPRDDHYGHWAASGEIDIMEAVNLGVPVATCGDCREDHILGTLHFGGEAPRNTRRGAETKLPPSADGFHVFGIEWRAGQISWSVDGQVYQTQTSKDWVTLSPLAAPGSGAPFDRPFYLVLNLAIGGGLPEGRNSGGVAAGGFPKRLLIDWVRVYRCTADPETGISCAVPPAG